MDLLLNESNTEEGILKFKNDEEGLIVKGTIIGEGISLSNAGYGEEYSISGEREGKTEIIQSKDMILRTVVKTFDEPEELTMSFWNKLKEYRQRRKKL